MVGIEQSTELMNCKKEKTLIPLSNTQPRDKLSSETREF